MSASSYRSERCHRLLGCLLCWTMFCFSLNPFENGEVGELIVYKGFKDEQNGALLLG